MSTLTIKETLNWGTHFLKSKNQESAGADARILLEYSLKKDATWIVLNPQKPISQTQLKKFRALIKKRATGYPIAYITGHKEFYDLDLIVDESVLIPRPETELVVDLVLSSVSDRRLISNSQILDIATGSGGVALTLAKHLPSANIIGSDISDAALRVARKNKKRLGIRNCRFIKSDLLDNIKSKPDIITANLPYLEKEHLKESSIKYEPRLALYGGKNGITLYKKLFQQIKKREWRNLLLFLEIGNSQAKTITRLAREILQSKSIITHKDLAKKDRVITIEL